MGGRGSAGTRSGTNRIAGAQITLKDGTRFNYEAVRVNGKSMTLSTGYGRDSIINMSISEVVKRAKENGATVKTFNQKQMDDKEKEYQKARARRPDYELEIGVPWRSEAGKRARQSRVATKAMKKKR